jgi:hypothetical protein
MLFEKPVFLSIDDFFPRFDWYENAFREIPVYTRDEHPERHEWPDSIRWPGSRSVNLFNENIFAAGVFTEALSQRLPFISDLALSCKLHTHLRTDDSNAGEFPHVDGTFLTVIVYLSPSNPESGTLFFNEAGDVVGDIGMVQNRAAIFSGNIKHMSKNNFGEGMDNGRLTLNAFIYLT